MKTVVFSGTTEGRRFSKKLAALGDEETVCVATPLGAEEQGEMAGITVHAGRLGPDAMAALLTGADLCVDATHPYAVDVTRNIRAAAAQAGVEYRRLLRARSPLPEDCVVFGTAAQAAEYLAGTKENILLATGAKELAAFAPLVTHLFNGLPQGDKILESSGLVLRLTQQGSRVEGAHEQDAALLDELPVLLCHRKVRADHPLRGNAAQTDHDLWP